MDEVLKEDVAYWRAVYDDGTEHSEALGHNYVQIDRSKLSEFHIMHGVKSMFCMFLPEGQDWRGFMFRRRTSLNSGYGRSVLFVMGWLSGPAVAVSLEHGAYNYMPNGFVEGSPDLYPPQKYEGIEF